MHVFIVVQDLLKLATFNGISQTCAQGKTVIECPAERVELPQTAFEKAFYPKHSSSSESLRWLEQEAALRKIHIHHAACGHGGQRWVERAPVDGYNHETLFFNIMDVIGLDVENVTLMIEIELLLIMTKHEKIDLKQLLNVHKSFELLATM